MCHTRMNQSCVTHEFMSCGKLTCPNTQTQTHAHTTTQTHIVREVLGGPSPQGAHTHAQACLHARVSAGHTHTCTRTHAHTLTHLALVGTGLMHMCGIIYPHVCQD